MATVNTFEWDTEVIDNFKLEAKYADYGYIKEQVEFYVEYSCNVPPGTTELKMITDLLDKIYE